MGARGADCGHAGLERGRRWDMRPPFAERLPMVVRRIERQQQPQPTTREFIEDRLHRLDTALRGERCRLRRLRTKPGGDRPRQAIEVRLERHRPTILHPQGLEPPFPGGHQRAGGGENGLARRKPAVIEAVTVGGLGHRRRMRQESWSGRRDLNSGPLAPHASALPDCATSRPTEGLKYNAPEWPPSPRDATATAQRRSSRKISSSSSRTWRMICWLWVLSLRASSPVSLLRAPPIVKPCS